MIERWFPCTEVSKHSAKGWGTGSAEKGLFTWFASRPLAQAKAAVICSLLSWPDEEGEQNRLKQLVRDSMQGYDSGNRELRDELARQYPKGARMCDPFSGRAMIPLEAARLGIQAWGLDYSPVATLAGKLLADYPLRDWDQEPDLPFEGYQQHKTDYFTEPRLLRDVRFVLDRIADLYEQEMGEYYPAVNGQRPWGYLWAVTLPCVNCGSSFPLTVSLALRNSSFRKRLQIEDPGQSFRIVVDGTTGKFCSRIHDGPPEALPTLVKVKGRRGKAAVCCFCGHSHPLDIQKRMMRDGLQGDAMLAVADSDEEVGKRYREPTEAEIEAVVAARKALAVEPSFGPGLPAIPDEPLNPGLSAFIGPAGYGYRTWGELCNDRQTLGFVRLARIIEGMSREMLTEGLSDDYTAALSGYAGSNLVRRLRRSTRSATLEIPYQKVHDIYFNDSGISHSFDYFETGCGDGPATWQSLATHTIRNLGKQLNGRFGGLPAIVQRGSAMELPMPDGMLDAVVTDPPYDAMINYCDSSDLLFAWLKRAIATSHPWIGVTTDPGGLQEKTNEAVIKFGSLGDDHRTEAHYRTCITSCNVHRDC